MLVVNRFRVPEEETESFRADLESALAVLSEQVGYAEDSSAATSTTRPCGRW